MMPMDKVDGLLESALEKQQLGHLLASFKAYLLLLQKWNKAYNLTAIRELDAMVSKHLLDSLAVLPWIHGSSILDVGSGAGFPGIPLALACPDKQFVLLDSNGKKARFLNEAKRVLGLENVTVIQDRVENYQNTSGFDTVTSRAFSNLAQFIEWTRHLIKSKGIWLAMKGLYPEEELAQIVYPYQVVSYPVEQLQGERCCVIIENKNNED